jgi:hypothetical protein
VRAVLRRAGTIEYIDSIKVAGTIQYIDGTLPY